MRVVPVGAHTSEGENQIASVGVIEHHHGHVTHELDHEGEHATVVGQVDVVDTSVDIQSVHRLSDVVRDQVSVTVVEGASGTPFLTERASVDANVVNTKDAVQSLNGCNDLSFD